MSSLLNNLQLQPIDDLYDDVSDNHRVQDEIDLDEQLNDEDLTSFWSEVVTDLHQDPNWSTFNQ